MSIYQKAIAKFVDRNVKRGRFEEEDRAVYEYAYLLLALQAFNVIAVFLIGIAAGELLGMVLFVLMTIPLRSFTGGSHASTPELCSFYSLLLETGVAILLRTQIYLRYMPAILLAALAAQVVIALYAPVEVPTKPMRPDEICKYRKKSRLVLVIEIGIMAVFGLLRFRKGMFLVAVCHIVTSLSIIMAKCKK